MRLMHVIPLLGIAQIISWGTLYYTIGVIGQPLREAAGVSEADLFGTFTFALLVSGLLAPRIGKLIDANGGRHVLSVGSAVGALALAALALAEGPVMLLIGWLLAGTAMAATLYDPAFATLHQLTREHYRRAVTALTLFGGFASTIFWPLTHVLMESLGWRSTLWLYAALQLFICLPVHAWALRKGHRVMMQPADGRPPALAAGSSPPQPNVTAGWLALSFTAASFVIAVIGVHMIGLLTTSGLTTAQAVGVGMLMGPMQVAGRLIEFGFLARARAATIGLAAYALLFTGVVCLIGTRELGVAAVLFVTSFGLGNGILTIVRGTAPAELIGRDGLGALLGRLARPAMLAKAVAPSVFTAILAAGLTRNHALWVLAAVVTLAWFGLGMAGRSAGKRNKTVTSLS